MNTHINLQLPAEPIGSDSEISPRWSPQVHYFFWDMSPMNSHPHLSQITTLPLDFSWSFTALGSAMLLSWKYLTKHKTVWT